MPTPMQLDCFCEHCQASPESPVHSYKLYAIIMHLGATMASGHYVAYTRVSPSTADYASCPRARAASAAAAAAAAAASASATSNATSSGRSSSERGSSTNSGSSGGGGGIMRFFKPKSSTSLAPEGVAAAGNTAPMTLCKYAHQIAKYSSTFC